MLLVSNEFDNIETMKLNSANERLSALGNLSRLFILSLLSECPGGLSGIELAEKLDIPAPTLSFHMSQLEKTRLIKSKRQGRSLLYTLNTSGLSELAEFLSNLSGGTMQETIQKKVVRVMDDYLPLPCGACGQDLIPDVDMAILVFAETYNRQPDKPKETRTVYVAHKNTCDRILRAKWDNRETLTGWEDLDTFTSPLGFLRLLLTVSNQRQRGDLYTEEAHKQLKAIIKPLSQFVFRDMTEEERADYKKDRELDFLKY